MKCQQCKGWKKLYEDRHEAWKMVCNTNTNLRNHIKALKLEVTKLNRVVLKRNRMINRLKGRINEYIRERTDVQ